MVLTRRTGRRVIPGALNAHSGAWVDLVRERSRQDDCSALRERLGAVRPDVPQLVLWDNAPPQHPKRVLQAAAHAPITSAWLPFGFPALTPLEDRWRLLQAVVAANRVYDTLDTLARQAIPWLDTHLPDSLLTCCGLRSSKFEWLPT